MAQYVVLLALLATVAARPQLLQVPQILQGPALPGGQVLTLVPVNGGASVQNQPGQIFVLQPTSGVASFGGLPSFGGFPSFGGLPSLEGGSLILLSPVAGQAPAVGSSLITPPVPTAPVAPVQAAVVVNPVTEAPVTVRPAPPPVQPVVVPPTPVQPVQVAVPAKPVSVSVAEKSEPAKYTYSYEVNDPSTGDVKSASETRDGDKVTGFYTVADPDGTLRRVQYTADINGFVASVDSKPSGIAAPVVAKPVGQVPVAVASTGAKVLTQFASPAVSFKWGTA